MKYYIPMFEDLLHNLKGAKKEKIYPIVISWFSDALPHFLIEPVCYINMKMNTLLYTRP